MVIGSVDLAAVELVDKANYKMTQSKLWMEVFLPVVNVSASVRYMLYSCSLFMLFMELYVNIDFHLKRL